LDDERRSLINVGDFIVFTNNVSGQKAVVKVLGLNRFKSFEELYSKMDMTKCGYECAEEASPTDMLQYYPYELQQKYGALGIEIEFIALL
jgi:ASC-1-like (ASCH) protein